MRLSKLSNHDSSFKLFILRVKTSLFLPPQIIPFFIKHIVSIVVEQGHNYGDFFRYLTEKFSSKFCEESSYYHTILAFRGTYLSTSNNISESYNHTLNNFVLSVSKTTNLNKILRKLRTHYIVTVRDVRRQLSMKKFNYEPSDIAIERFQKARVFTNKALDLNINLRLLKKLTKMIDVFYD